MKETKQSKPIIYLNHWDYKKHALVKLVLKKASKGFYEYLHKHSWIKYSKNYKCYYFVKTSESLELFYSSFSGLATINDWYLRKRGNIILKPGIAVNPNGLELLRKSNKKPLLWLLPVNDKYYTKHIMLKFKYDKAIYASLKRMPITEWAKNLAGFVIERNTKAINEVILNIRHLSKIVVSKELKIKDPETLQLLLGQSYKSEEISPCPDSYLHKLLALNYSRNTINSYYKHFLGFVNFFKGRDIDCIGKDEIEVYINTINESGQVSPQYIHLLISAIKFYYQKVLGRQKEHYKITRPVKECKLPNVMSEGEVQRLLKAPQNIKHKCILLLIYSSGLRKSEAINIKISDIQKERDLLFIRNAKGKKDRYTILSGKIRKILREYYIKYKPKEWLFEGQFGTRYSVGSIQKIFERAKKKAGITRYVTCHCLRHSFASHLIERGVDIKVVQELLGHASIKTTQIYTHVAMSKLQSIKSPLDNLDI